MPSSAPQTRSGHSILEQIKETPPEGILGQVLIATEQAKAEPEAPPGPSPAHLGFIQQGMTSKRRKAAKRTIHVNVAAVGANQTRQANHTYNRLSREDRQKIHPTIVIHQGGKKYEVDGVVIHGPCALKYLESGNPAHVVIESDGEIEIYRRPKDKRLPKYVPRTFRAC